YSACDRRSSPSPARAGSPPGRAGRSLRLRRSRQRGEVLGEGAQAPREVAALLWREHALHVEEHREVLLAESLAGGRIGGIPALPPAERRLAQAFLRLARAHDGEQLRLQALVVAIAQLVEDRRALGVLAHALELRVGEGPHPVLEALARALEAQPP